MVTTSFSQSQGRRHTVAVCWHLCMNTNAQTWKSRTAFQLSFLRLCEKKTGYNQIKKKEKKSSLSLSQILCTEIARKFEKHFKISAPCRRALILRFCLSSDNLRQNSGEHVGNGRAVQLLWKPAKTKTTRLWPQFVSQHIPHVNNAVHLGPPASTVVNHLPLSRLFPVWMSSWALQGRVCRSFPSPLWPQIPRKQ